MPSWHTSCSTSSRNTSTQLMAFASSPASVGAVVRPHAAATVAAALSTGSSSPSLLPFARRSSNAPAKRILQICRSSFYMFGNPDDPELPQHVLGFQLVRKSKTGTTGDRIAMGARAQLAKRQKDLEGLQFDFDTKYLDSSRRNAGVSLGLLRQLFVQLRHDREGLKGLQAYFEFQAAVQELGTELDTSGLSSASVLPADSGAADSAEDGSSSDMDPSSTLLVKLALLACNNPNTAATQAKLQSIAAMVERSVVHNASPRETLRCLNTVLFEYYHFTAARESKLYHPDSFCLSKVLEKRMGSPTALGIIYLVIARMLGLQADAISLPSHFLVRVTLDSQDVLVDPYNGGRTLSESDLAELLGDNLQLPTTLNRFPTAANSTDGLSMASVSGDGGESASQESSPSPSAAAAAAGGAESTGSLSTNINGGSTTSFGSGQWFERYLVPASVSDVVLRLLRNLREVYWVPLLRRQVSLSSPSQRQWHHTQAMSVLRLLRLLQPDIEGPTTDLACCMASGLGRYSEAMDLLRNYLSLHPESGEVHRALFLLEQEAASTERVKAMERKENERLRRQRLADAGLNPKNLPTEQDPGKLFGKNPDYFSRMYGRLWDDNYWVSSLLDNNVVEGDDDKKGKGKAGK